MCLSFSCVAFIALLVLGCFRVLLYCVVFDCFRCIVFCWCVCCIGVCSCVQFVVVLVLFVLACCLWFVVLCLFHWFRFRVVLNCLFFFFWRGFDFVGVCSSFLFVDYTTLVVLGCFWGVLIYCVVAV